MWLEFIVVILSFALVGGLVALAVQYYWLSKPKATRVKSPLASNNLMLYFIIGLFAVGGLGYGLITALDDGYTPSKTRIPSALRVETPSGEEINVNFYLDVLGQELVTSIDYGEFSVGETSALTFWVRNESPVNPWLTLDWENLNPADADQYITLSWDWVKLIDTWKAYPEDFSIYDAMLRCASNPADPIILARVEPGFNYEIETRTIVTVSSVNRPESQIVFRYRDSQNYYFAGLGAWGYKAAIGKVVNGVATRIAQSGNPNYVDIELNQWYDVKVRVSGNTFTCYIDGEALCVVEDSSIGYGDIAKRLTVDIARECVT